MDKHYMILFGSMEATSGSMNFVHYENFIISIHSCHILFPLFRVCIIVQYSILWACVIELR